LVDDAGSVSFDSSLNEDSMFKQSKNGDESSSPKRQNTRHMSFMSPKGVGVNIGKF